MLKSWGFLFCRLCVFIYRLILKCVQNKARCRLWVGRKAADGLASPGHGNGWGRWQKSSNALNPQMTKLNGCLFSINPSKISSPETTNNINCAINGLCKTADKFPGGKAALTALNYFTGMPIKHLLKNL